MAMGPEYLVDLDEKREDDGEDETDIADFRTLFLHVNINNNYIWRWS